MARGIGAGTVVGGYRIEGLLGKGGMGAVYSAVKLDSGERVALKILSESLAQNDEFRERFLREARYAARVEHPNVVRVLAAGEADGQLFIAQDAIEGTDLEALLAVEGAIEAPRALAILAQAAEALDAVHDAGLLHRDIKPANVLLAGAAGAEHAFLTDFGLSKQPTHESRALTASGSFVGNFYYAAPEQVLGKELSPEADVYALGCVLYECLTAAPPFQGERAIDLLEAHVEDPPPKVSAKRPDLPEAIDEVVARAMDKDPAARYARASELVAAARAALGVAVLPLSGRQLRLVATAGPGSGLDLPLDGGLEIGRAASGGGALGGDPELSRHHARITCAEDGVHVLEDLGSTNGTLVNGHVLAGPHILSAGDTIEVGSTTLRVDLAEEPPLPAPSESGEPTPPSEPAPMDAREPAAVEAARVPPPAPEAPPHVELRVDVDFAAREATITLADGSDSIRLVQDEGRWRLESD